jgi:hypothetical protein
MGGRHDMHTENPGNKRQDRGEQARTTKERDRRGVRRRGHNGPPSRFGLSVHSWFRSFKATGPVAGHLPLQRSGTEFCFLPRPVHVIGRGSSALAVKFMWGTH